jgi:hypothetical protein
MSKLNLDHLTDEILHEFLDGELNIEDQSKVQLHLEDCQDCSSRLRIWTTLFVEIEQLPDLEDVVDFKSLVLADLTETGSRRNRVLWMFLGQGALAISLIAYGWQRISTSLPLKQVSDWLTLPVQVLQGMIDSLLLGLVESFNQFLSWSLSSGDLLLQVPQITSGGTLLIYLGLLAVALWVLINHYLLRINGQPEDTRPQY